MLILYVLSVDDGKTKIQTHLFERHSHDSHSSKLLVYIGTMDGKAIPLRSLYLWIVSGWSVLQVRYRGTPTLFKNDHSAIGGKLEKEMSDCHEAVTRAIESNGYGQVLLMGEGMGGTIAFNLATKYPDNYDHLVVVNPVVSLTSLAVLRPNYLKRILKPSQNWFTSADIAEAWKVSPLSQID